MKRITLITEEQVPCDNCVLARFDFEARAVAHVVM